MVGYRALICGLAAAFLGAAPARALTISFSYHQPSAGTVSGEVDGLLANGNDQQATALFVDSVPASFAPFLPPTPFNVFPPTVTVYSNDFDVSNGKITFVNFLAEGLFGYGNFPGKGLQIAWCIGNDCVIGSGTAPGPGNQMSFSFSSDCGPCRMHIETPLPPAFPLYMTSLILMMIALLRQRLIERPRRRARVDGSVNIMIAGHIA